MSKKIHITFLATVNERTLLRTRAAEADSTQAELLLRLLEKYGEQEAQLMRQEKYHHELAS
jgi:hypothetical protein